MTAAPPPGIYEGVPDVEYRAWEAISYSGLKELQRSPAHYKAYLEDGSDTNAKRFGRALHAAVLQPEAFYLRFFVRPVFTGEGSVAARKQWNEKHAKHEILSEADAVGVTAMRHALKAHEFTQRLFSKGKSEVSLCWIDPDYGVLCKARLDHWVGGMVADLKSCEDAGYDAFRRAIWNYLYYLQPPFYLDGLYQLTGKMCGPFLFVAVEKSAPYGVRVYEMQPDSDDVQYGRERYKPLLSLYKECCESGEWPSYPPVVQTMYLRRAM